MGFDIPIPVLFMIIVGTVILAGAAYSAYAEKKRREAIQRVANELGLAFYAEGMPDLLSQLSDLVLFSKGKSRRITNMIYGETDAAVMGIFDYRYTTGSGKNSHTHRHSVAFFRSADLDLPVFQLCPESFFHGIAKVFGYNDIEFEAHPTFSKAYLLRGPNEEEIRNTFDHRLLETFEQKRGICVEGQHQDMIVYRQTKRVQPEAFKELMNEGFTIFTLFRGEP